MDPLGLAAGIDTMAHETAIGCGGRTIAVLGTPQHHYPASNRDLQARIAEHHLLVSQFPEGHPVSRGNFVMRDNTTALISDATIIVKVAGEDSGTGHAGREAIRPGRPLFVCRPAAAKGPEWLQEMISKHGAVILDGDDSYGEVLLSMPAGFANYEIPRHVTTSRKSTKSARPTTLSTFCGTRLL